MPFMYTLDQAVDVVESVLRKRPCVCPDRFPWPRWCV